jgi:hypothetical protein
MRELIATWSPRVGGGGTFLYVRFGLNSDIRDDGGCSANRQLQTSVPAISQANLFTPGALGLRMGDSWPEKDFPMLRVKADAHTRQLAMRIRRGGAFS